MVEETKSNIVDNTKENNINNTSDTPITPNPVAPNIPTNPSTKEDNSKNDSKNDELSFKLLLKPRILRLPNLTTKNINIRYPLIPPYAFAHIFLDKNNELVYYVEEPKLNDVEAELLNLIMLGLEETLNVEFVGAVNQESAIKYLEKSTKSILSELGAKVTKESFEKIMYYVYRNSVGLNKIEPLLRDYYIEDIECNGVGIPIYIVHRKYENMRTNIVYESDDELRDFVEKLAQKCGKYISYAQPLLDAALPDGSRVNATYSSDVTTRGPTFTIRKFTEKPLTPTSLISNNTATPEMFAYFWLAIDNKMNTMVIGETASGKTTFLNAILHFIPSEDRIASIEDTRELNLAHQNWIPAVTRVSFGTKIGEIDLFDLLRETFRQNPDYVVVGEVRGKETFVLFQGMASGHSCYSTFHAGSFSTLVRRLETPPISLPPELVDSLDIVVIMTHQKQQDKNIRRVREVDEVLPYDKEKKHNVHVVFKWNPINDSFLMSQESVVLEKISSRTGLSVQELKQELNFRAELLRRMTKQGILDFEDFSRVINDYHRNKESVLKKFGII